MHRLPLFAALSLLLVACPIPVDEPNVEEEPTPAPRPGPDYSGGDCPTFEEGWNTGFETGGLDRQFRLDLPDEPTGKPLLFVWHWLGGMPNDIVDWVDFDELVDDEDVIVVAPESRHLAVEWDLQSQPEDNADYALFVDLLACLSDQYEVDLDRVYSTGMSAGGLMTTYLTAFGTEWLAATAPMSGGTSEAAYVTPERAIPVLLTWGGPTDTYNGFSFDDANLVFSELLREDGHFVAHCVHSGGHDVPAGAAAMVWEFLADHPLGVDPEPYRDGMPASFPEGCEVPEQSLED